MLVGEGAFGANDALGDGGFGGEEGAGDLVGGEAAEETEGEGGAGVTPSAARRVPETVPV